MKGKGINVGRMVIAALVVWVVSGVYGMLTCGWLFSWIYEIPPVLWKAPEEIMSMGNAIYSYGISVILFLLLVLVYAILYKGIPGKGVTKGMTYGFFIWIVGPLTGVIMMPGYMNIAWAVIIYWIINLLVINLINGAIIGAIYKND